MAFTKEKFTELCKAGNPKDLLQYLHDENVSPDQSISEKSADTLLISAVEEDSSVDILKALLDFGIDINAKGAMGRSALMSATLYDADFETVKFLLDAGSDINAKDNDGYTPLMLAFYHSGKVYIPVVMLLLEYVADINIVNDGGETALSLAYDNYPKYDVYNDADREEKKNNFEALKILISNGADVNCKVHCEPFIWEAADSRVPEVVELLVAAGANLNVKYGGETPMEVA